MVEQTIMRVLEAASRVVEHEKLKELELLAELHQLEVVGKKMVKLHTFVSVRDSQGAVSKIGLPQGLRNDFYATEEIAGVSMRPVGGKGHWKYILENK